MEKFCADCGKPIHACECVSAKDDILNIFENEIKPCEGEEKIKAYHVSRLQDDNGLTVHADGVLTITNKRVIYRTTKNTETLDFIHNEVPILDVAGVSIKRAQYFDLWTLIGNILRFIFVVAIVVGIPVLISNFAESSLAVFVYFLVLIIVLGIAFIIKHKMFTAENMGQFLGGIIKWMFKDVDKPLMYLTIISKGGVQGSITMATFGEESKEWEKAAQNVPLEDLLVFSQEMGAIISDIQSGMI